MLKRYSVNRHINKSEKQQILTLSEMDLLDVENCLYRLISYVLAPADADINIGL